MKKVCFLCDSVLSIGGVQRVLAVIAIALSKEYDVTIISLQDDEKSDMSLYDLDKSNVKIKFFHPIFPNGLYNKWHLIGSGIYKEILPKNKLTSEFYAHTSFPRSLRKQFINKLNSQQFDTIIGVHGGLSMKLATIRHKLNARKVIGWMHNSYEAFFEKSPAYYEGLASHFRFQMRKLDDFIVLCHADAKRYAEEMKLKPIVIYNPLTIATGRECNPFCKRFLSVGRMTPLHKGFDILIEAFALFAQEDQEWQLDIVGEGEEEEKLKQLVTEKKLEQRIHFHKFTHHIQDYYQQASVYVLASRWEGFGLVLVEAMSHGLRIISCDLPVTHELLPKECSALFISEDINSLYETMKRYTSTSDKIIKAESVKAIKTASMFRIEETCKHWMNIINA